MSLSIGYLMVLPFYDLLTYRSREIDTTHRRRLMQERSFLCGRHNGKWRLRQIEKNSITVKRIRERFIRVAISIIRYPSVCSVPTYQCCFAPLSNQMQFCAYFTGFYVCSNATDHKLGHTNSSDSKNRGRTCFNPSHVGYSYVQCPRHFSCIMCGK